MKPPRVDPFSVLDAARRLQGMVFDACGWGPVQTDSEVLFSGPHARVHSYGPSTLHGPPVLLVPAPIKRAYIWDLEPGKSVVRRLKESGFGVHLLEWMDPGPDQQDLGLDHYVGDLLRAAVDAVRSTTGDTPALLGHSLGGTFAAMLAAMYPDVVRGLALFEAPLRFGLHAGAFAPVVAAAPDTSWVRPAFGNVPGSFISTVSANAAPGTFHLDRHLDLLASLGRPFLQTHLRVQRWALDEMAMPGRLFQDIVEQLYREDRFMRGQLVVAGRRIGPQLVTCPLFSVVNPASAIIPPQAVLPFHEATASSGKTLVQYRGDRGVALQHAGILVGATAHAQMWPQVVRWLRNLDSGGAVQATP